MGVSSHLWRIESKWMLPTSDRANLIYTVFYSIQPAALLHSTRIKLSFHLCDYWGMGYFFFWFGFAFWGLLFYLVSPLNHYSWILGPWLSKIRVTLTQVPQYCKYLSTLIAKMAAKWPMDRRPVKGAIQIPGNAEWNAQYSVSLRTVHSFKLFVHFWKFSV